MCPWEGRMLLSSFARLAQKKKYRDQAATQRTLCGVRFGCRCCYSTCCRAFLGGDWAPLLLPSFQGLSGSSGMRPRHPAASRAATGSRHRYRREAAARGRHCRRRMLLPTTVGAAGGGEGAALRRRGLLSFFRASKTYRKIIDKAKGQGHIRRFGVYLLKSDKIMS